MSVYELAQLNIATMNEPLESPGMADFVANLDRVNALAENSPGFVWRLQTEEGDATAVRPMGNDVLVNMSVWRDVESLNKYVYGSAHVEIMRRRKEWFLQGLPVYSIAGIPSSPHGLRAEEATPHRTGCTSTGGLVALNGAGPDTNRSAGLHSGIVVAIMARLKPVRVHLLPV